MLEQKQKDYNWYYTSATIHRPGEQGLRWLKFVTFADNPTQAREIAEMYARDRMQPGEALYGTDRDNGIHFYQKNYIRDSRALVASGAYAGVKPLGV